MHDAGPAHDETRPRAAGQVADRAGGIAGGLLVAAADVADAFFLGRAKLALIRNIDVILCRNVIATFDSEGKQRMIEMFWDKLRPGGHLLLGHSESLVGLSTPFELRRLKDELVYRKPSSGMGLRDPWQVAAETVLARDSAETDE